MHVRGTVAGMPGHHRRREKWMRSPAAEALVRSQRDGAGQLKVRAGGGEDMKVSYLATLINSQWQSKLSVNQATHTISVIPLCQWRQEWHRRVTASCIHVYIRTFICIYILIYTHAYLQFYIYMYMHIYIYIRIIYIYICGRPPPVDRPCPFQVSRSAWSVIGWVTISPPQFRNFQNSRP